jgi:hypothetical protein
MKTLLALGICGLLLVTSCTKKQEPAPVDSMKTAASDHGKGIPPPMNITIPANGQTTASNDVTVQLQTVESWEHVTINPPSVDNKTSLDSLNPSAVLSPSVTYQLNNTTSQEIVVVVQPAQPNMDSLKKH